MMESAQDRTLNLQRYILALLYVSTGGDEWANNEKWMTSVSECEWYGVSCDSFEGMIDGIDLSNNNLKGFLLSELGELRGVERLVRYIANSTHVDNTHVLKQLNARF